MPPHVHSLPSVTFVLSGELRELGPGTDEVAGPLSVVVKPAGVRHEDMFGPGGARTLQVVVDSPDEAGQIWEGGWRWIHARSGVPEFLALAHAVAPGSVRSAEECESVVWEIFGALSQGPEEANRRVAPPWLQRVREEIDDRPLDAPSVQDLAARVGIHPVSLARAFRRHFGESITGYRLRLRLRRGAQLLARGGMTVSEAAHAAGFADHPHFSRTFRDRTGVPPSEFARLLHRPSESRV